MTRYPEIAEIVGFCVFYVHDNHSIQRCTQDRLLCLPISPLVVYRYFIIYIQLQVVEY